MNLSPLIEKTDVLKLPQQLHDLQDCNVTSFREDRTVGHVSSDQMCGDPKLDFAKLLTKNATNRKLELKPAV